MFSQTRDHEITYSREKSHTSSIILNQNIHHIWSTHLTSHWNFNLRLEWKKKKHANNSNHVQRKHDDDKCEWAANGALTYFWIFNFDFNVKIIQRSIEIMHPECRVRKCARAHQLFTYLLVGALCSNFFFRIFTFRLVYRIWERENRNFPVAPMHSISLYSCQLTNVFNSANSSRRLSGNWGAQNFSVSIFFVIFFVFYIQLWYFFIAAICDDMTVRLRDGVADILYLASREFVCLNKRLCVSHKCGVGLGLVNGMAYGFISRVVYWNMTAKTDTVARSFRVRKFECTFLCVRQSLLFVYNTVNNYISFSVSPSIDRPSFPTSRLLHCYSFEFDELFSMKTLNLTNGRK